MEFKVIDGKFPTPEEGKKNIQDFYEDLTDYVIGYCADNGIVLAELIGVLELCKNEILKNNTEN